LDNPPFDLELAGETSSILSKGGFFIQRLSSSELTSIAGGFLYTARKPDIELCLYVWLSKTS